jgi:inorganic pyrophosphatase
MTAHPFDTLTARDEHGHVRVIVENPRGSTVKLKYDAKLHLFTWSRPLPVGISLPFDLGFIPGTLADDGDPVDAFLYTDVASCAGVLARGRVVAALRIEQQRDGGPVKRNDRVLVVPVEAHRQADVRDLADIPLRVREEIEAFCLAAVALTGKQIRLAGWADAAVASAAIDAAVV